MLALSLLAAQGFSEPSPLSADVHRCALVEDMQDRLECFAALERSLNVAEESALAGSAGSAGSAGEPQVLLAPTGADGSESESRSVAGSQQQPALIRSAIIKLQQRPRGEYVFSLANGEVWTQVQPQSLPFAEGATVEIRRTTFGSHLLSQDSGRSTRVRRIDN
ncbi:MAG: hypothetical protein ACNA7W_15290 [Pseudomonadales bacterium]